MKPGFNLIGFGPRGLGRDNPANFKHCPFDLGIRLIPDPKDPDKLFCPACGFSALAQEAPSEEGLTPTHGSKNKTRIISGKGRPKKHYDSFANLIPDDDLDAQQDLKLGHKIMYYNEQVDKSGIEKKRHVVRK